jgi:hypothetical protein
MWAQARRVPTLNARGELYDNDTLTAELRRNPIFSAVPLCIKAHWHGNIDNIRAKPDRAATVMFAYLDRDGTLSRDIGRAGIHMFGVKTLFVVVGENPRFVQCGWCHHLNHTTEECRLKAGAFRCYICGGARQSTQHNRECKGKHAIGGVCNCAFPCLLCGKTGHHARSRSCPKRGSFRATPLDGETQPPQPAPPATPHLLASTLPVRDLAQLSRNQIKNRKKREAKARRQSTAPFASLHMAELLPADFDTPGDIQNWYGDYDDIMEPPTRWDVWICLR